MPKYKLCKGCNGLFNPKSKKQVYCTNSCRKEHYGKVYYDIQSADKLCPNCGVIFPTKKVYIQIFCSPECREEARSKNILSQPLDYLDKAVAHMTKLFEELHTLNSTRAATLQKYFSHYLVYTPLPDYLTDNDGYGPHNHTTSCTINCALCNRASGHLRQHKGMMLCPDCVTFADYVDRGYVTRYNELLSAKNPTA